MAADAERKYIRYEVDEKVGIITLARAEKANAQNEVFLDELDACFDLATASREVRVIVLRAEGKHFSAGHDLKVDDEQPKLANDDGSWWLSELYDWECRKYLGFGLKWRNIPKPTIAAVQGKCIAGALNLIWPMDLIIAAENATFSDPVVALGACGVEYHGHTWEFGARKAKEMLFTGRSMTAHEAEQIGMVNRVVPLDELWPNAMALAHEISQFHPFALRQAKRAVNQTLDVMGQHAALQSAFDIHHTTHGNAISVTGYPVMASLDDMKGRIKDQ